VLRSAILAVLLSGCAAERRTDPDLVIEHVTLIDGTDAPSRGDISVAIKGETIVAVAPSRELGRLTTTAVRIDGRRKYLMPGLWDMHVHLFGYDEHAFPLFLANGVTTIRDVGGNLEQVLRLRGEIRATRLLGPTMLVAGPTLDAEYMVRAVGGTPFAGARATVSDSSSGTRMVDSLARAGVDQIKVHSMTPRAAYFAILAEAQRRGIPVVGHIPDSVLPDEAIAGGQRTIEHDFRISLGMSPVGRGITAWMLAAMQRHLDSTRLHPHYNPLFVPRIAADDSGRRTFDSATAAGFAARAAKAAVWFDPTLAADEAMIRVSDPSVRQRPEWKYIPQRARAIEDGLPAVASPSAAELMTARGEWQDVLAMFRPLVRAGAKFVAGSDIPTLPLAPGFSLHWELEELVAMGLSSRQAIQAATRNAADAVGRLGQVGTVEVGRSADLVLLDADPLTSIGNTRRIRAVITRGRLLDRAMLDRMLAEAEAFANRERHLDTSIQPILFPNRSEK
jgi:imidazolonepropionase-like amidohydrolase